MPIYEYKCRKCGERFDLRRSFSDNSPVSCSRCGTADAEKLLSSFGKTSGGSDAPRPNSARPLHKPTL